MKPFSKKRFKFINVVLYSWDLYFSIHVQNIVSLLSKKAKQKHLFTSCVHSSPGSESSRKGWQPHKQLVISGLTGTLMSIHASAHYQHRRRSNNSNPRGIHSPSPLAPGKRKGLRAVPSCCFLEKHQTLVLFFTGKVRKTLPLLCFLAPSPTSAKPSVNFRNVSRTQLTVQKKNLCLDTVNTLGSMIHKTEK